MRISLMSNLSKLKEAHRDGIEIRLIAYPHRGTGRFAPIHAWWRLLRSDYALINCAPMDLFLLCFFKLLWPFHHCKVVSMDTVLPVPHPRTFGQRCNLWLKKLLFRQVHLFIEYFKQTEGYEKHYGIPRAKFRYIPFKINRYEAVVRTATRDDGYIFCGGNTRRDFATLIAAVKDLPYPVKIVTMRDAVITASGSFLDEQNLPPNIQVIRHDGSESFLEFIAAARMVVLPIRKENISASGIGVYLASMALGKCVVISEGPAVNGVVPDQAAIIVPPEDPEALRQAVRKAYEDDAYRQSIAEAGRRYALSLKGEERLYQSALDVLVADHAGRQ